MLEIIDFLKNVLCVFFFFFFSASLNALNCAGKTETLNMCSFFVDVSSIHELMKDTEINTSRKQTDFY